MEEIFIDAANQVAGRLASMAAKEALKGKKVYIFNAEKAIISGNPHHIIEKYKEKLLRGDPYKGPFYPRQPDRILRRMIRGMLPYKKPRGRDAYKRVKVFISLPEEYSNKKLQRFKASENTLQCKSISLGELSILIGGKKTWK